MTHMIDMTHMIKIPSYDTVASYELGMLMVLYTEEANANIEALV